MRGRAGFLNFQIHVNRIADKDRLDELPFVHFAERNHRAVQDACLPGQARSDGQSQQSMRNLSPNIVVLLNSGSVWMRLLSPDRAANVMMSFSVMVRFSVITFWPTLNSSSRGPS